MQNIRVNSIEDIFIYSDFNDLVDDFISYKRSFRLTDITINGCRYYITRFFKYSNGKYDIFNYFLETNVNSVIRSFILQNFENYNNNIDYRNSILNDLYYKNGIRDGAFLIIECIKFDNKF